MAINFKISNATPKTGKSICVTCKHAVIVKGQNCEEHVVCHNEVFSATRNRVPFPVAECGGYHPSNVAWLHEMEQMAWKIEARKREKPGFAGAVPEPKEEVMEVTIKPPTKRRNPWDAPEED